MKMVLFQNFIEKLFQSKAVWKKCLEGAPLLFRNTSNTT